MSLFCQKPDALSFLTKSTERLKELLLSDPEFLEELLPLDDWIEEG